MNLKLLVLVNIVLVLCGCQDSRAKKEVDLDIAIRRELPEGTRKDAVLAFLDQHKISHEDSKDIPYYKGPRRVWGGRTLAPGLTITDFVFTFDFDGNDRLVAYKMEKRSVGP